MCLNTFLNASFSQFLNFDGFFLKSQFIASSQEGQDVFFRGKVYSVLINVFMASYR